MSTEVPTSIVRVRSLDSLRGSDAGYAGGKGANLGELMSAGVPVPPGFVIGAPAYAEFCEETGVRRSLDELLGTIDVDDSAALEAAAVRAQEIVAGAQVPEWLRDAVRQALAELGAGDEDAVAVRSSATTDDGASASFAGMTETFLNVRGADAVLDAVRSCWASMFSARTVFYRAKRLRAGRPGHRGGHPAPDRLHPGRGHVHHQPRQRRRQPPRDRGRVRPR